MRFRPAPADEVLFVRLVSEGGQWQLGLHRVLFGVRVMAFRTGSMFVAVNYCAGREPYLMQRLLTAIQVILERFPESAREVDVEAVMPGFSVKPIWQDATCWPNIARLAYGQVAV